MQFPRVPVAILSGLEIGVVHQLLEDVRGHAGIPMPLGIAVTVGVGEDPALVEGQHPGDRLPVLLHGRGDQEVGQRVDPGAGVFAPPRRGARPDGQGRKAGLGDRFRTAVADGTPVAGIAGTATEWQTAVSWTPYFAVANADEAAARVREHGGTVAVGPIAFPPGRAALLADRDHGGSGLDETEHDAVLRDPDGAPFKQSETARSTAPS